MIYKDINSSMRREPDRKQMKMIAEGFSRKIGSVYLPPNLTALEFEGERVWGIIWKITRGLFFKEYGIVLHDEIHRKYISITCGKQKQPDEFALLNSGSKGLHPKVMEYMYFEDDEYKDIHIWAILFWQTINVVLKFRYPD